MPITSRLFWAAAACLLRTTLALSCSVEDLQGILPRGTTALAAVSVADNGTFGDPSEIAYPAISSGLPALCALTVNATSSPSSSYRFGVFLPEDWNGRFAAVGNGGLAGGINWPSMSAMVRYGFAVVSTDTGHNGTSIDGSFVFNGPETLTDWQHRAMHGTVVHGKDIVSAHYGRNISYSYYNGCSTGGRQGLLEMQLYPEDFDGILAGAPAWESNKIASYMVQMGSLNQPNTSAHHIPPSLYPLIQAEALRQCDPVDGVTDGVISDPQACHFRPGTLLCAPSQNSSNSSCLTEPQLTTLHHLYGHTHSIPAPLFYHPLSPGSEAEWPRSLPSDGPLILGTNSLAYLTLRDPDWDWRTFNYTLVLSRDADGDKRGIPSSFGNASAFAARGGKVLAYHGLADTLIPWQTSRVFYDATLGALGSGYSENEETMDGFFRLFFIPGLMHCAGGASEAAPWFLGGAGSMPALMGSLASAAAGVDGVHVHSTPGFEDAEHDAVLALMRWVEDGEGDGKAPDWLVTTKWVDDDVAGGGGEVQAQRKVCTYPRRARLVGEGGESREGGELAVCLVGRGAVVKQGGCAGWERAVGDSELKKRYTRIENAGFCYDTFDIRCS